MPAITFSAQVGSDGFTIARAVATDLHYRYYDWQITSKAAAMSGLNDGARDLGEKILGRLSAATVLEEELPIGMLPPSPTILKSALETLSLDDYRTTIEEVVRQLASEGEVVIVGHVSQVVLHDWPGVLKVLVKGSFAQRAARVAAEQRISQAEATRVVMELDQMRRGFFEQVYHVDWLDSSLYDLTINTDQIPTATATQMILSAVCGSGSLAETDFRKRAAEARAEQAQPGRLTSLREAA
jgi:cytidylate kinase